MKYVKTNHAVEVIPQLKIKKKKSVHSTRQKRSWSVTPEQDRSSLSSDVTL